MNRTHETSFIYLRIRTDFNTLRIFDSSMFVLLLTLWLFIIMFFDYFEIVCPPLSPSSLKLSKFLNQGDPLGIHDPSEAELGGVGHENVGPFVKRSRKILRGLLLMVIIALCWVAVIHLFRISFHRERILYSISAEHFNISKLFSSSSNNRPNSKQIENQNLNETKNLFRLLPPSQPPTPMALTSNKVCV